MNEALRKDAEHLLAEMKPFSSSAAPGQNLLPPDTRTDVEGPGFSTPVWRAGHGPASLFVHGWEDTNRVWRSFAMNFIQQGEPVVLMDLPGHGASRAETWTWIDAGDAVKSVCDAEAPLEAVIAHSFGCKATVRAIELGADVPAIVLIAPPLVTSGRGWEARLQQKGIDQQVIDATRALFLEQTGKDIDGPDMAGVLANYPGRVLFVGSEADEECPLASIEDLAKRIPGAELYGALDLSHRDLALAPEILADIRNFLGR